MHFPAPALFLLTAGLVSAREGSVTRGIVSSPSHPHHKREASPLSPSTNSLPLHRHNSKGRKSRTAAHLLHGGLARRDISPSKQSTTLDSLFEGQEFATNIQFGNQTFASIVDTGSSDTWVVEESFQCVDIETEEKLSKKDCKFGPGYTRGSTFDQIPKEVFNITYGDGEFAGGIMGYEDVTLAGIKVRQEVAIVNYAAWSGDGVTSGLTGLAYPALTSAFDASNANVSRHYRPIFKTMSDQGLTAPLFSIAILRNESGPAGFLSLGGTPPIKFTNEFTSTPILLTTVNAGAKTHDFYTIKVDTIKVNGKSLKGGYYIVDSGTSLNYLPNHLAKAVNDAFNPPAKYDKKEDVYVVDCNATAPDLGTMIAGTVFKTSPLDLILPSGKDDNGKELCITGIVNGGNDPSQDTYILGDVFQKNVVTVYDIGASLLRFAPRDSDD